MSASGWGVSSRTGFLISPLSNNRPWATSWPHLGPHIPHYLYSHWVSMGKANKIRTLARHPDTCQFGVGGRESGRGMWVGVVRLKDSWFQGEPAFEPSQKAQGPTGSPSPSIPWTLAGQPEVIGLGSWVVTWRHYVLPPWPRFQVLCVFSSNHNHKGPGQFSWKSIKTRWVTVGDKNEPHQLAEAYQSLDGLFIR